MLTPEQKEAVTTALEFINVSLDGVDGGESILDELDISDEAFEEAIQTLNKMVED